MLQHLSIKNYILIQQLEIDFSAGFNVITGETGAGKSIILGALGLILGKRADSEALFDKDNKCVIEAVFQIDASFVKTFFEFHQLDEENECILRREIAKSGKSRAFINDTPVKLNVLKALGDLLVDIHSQHQTLRLTQKEYPLFVLDSLAVKRNIINDYTLLFKEYSAYKKQLVVKRELNEKVQSEKDYFSFLFDELDKAAFISGEQEKLETELSFLQNAEEVNMVMQQADQTICSDGDGVLDQLKKMHTSLNKLTDYHCSISEVTDRVKSVIIELEDVAQEFLKLGEKAEPSPEKMLIMSERMDTIHRLLQKHRLNSIDELLEKQQELEDKLVSISNMDTEIDTLILAIEKAEKELYKKAETMHLLRISRVKDLEKKMVNTLKELHISEAQFKIAITKSSVLNERGFDKVEFLFSANNGVELNEISKAASGGELSRIMLALKSILGREAVPTMIFDEIDSGVSGIAASKVAQLLSVMSQHNQLICISHLPQIASRGDRHFKVIKINKDNKSLTHIIELKNEERTKEIAQLFSGSEISEAALEQAEKMIFNVK